MCKAYAGLIMYLVAACAACGQDITMVAPPTNMAKADRTFAANLWPEADDAGKAESFTETADKSTRSDSHKNGRLQLSLEADYLRFRSSLFTANSVGTNTSVSYVLNDPLGVECAVATAFGHEIYDREHVKYLGVGCGPRVAWGTGRIEPWGHVLAGWSHLQPQTAGTSRSALSIVAGGGADYRVSEGFSLRVETNYVRTTFFKSNQNNIQVSMGVVFHYSGFGQR